MHRIFLAGRFLSKITLGFGLCALGCGKDEAATGGSGGTQPGNDAGSTVAGCNVVVEPGSNDTETVQGGLIKLKTGQTLCLKPGTYHFDKLITLNGTTNVTVKGLGSTRDEVILDFKGQTSGDDAFTVQADRFTIENLSVKDPPGDGVKVTNSDRPTFRNVHAFYSTGSVSTNGGYALYPAECTNVLIEECEVEGSTDAAIYLGQSTTGVVRKNKAHDSVIGIEAENSMDVEVYDNEAWHNTTGILIVNLPGLVHEGVQRVSVHDNFAHENDLKNFAPILGQDAGLTALAAGSQQGVGILVLAADSTEIFKNTVQKNTGTGILLASWDTFATVSNPPLTYDDPKYDEYTELVHLHHDNIMSENGITPPEPLNLIHMPLEDIVWDG